MPSKHFPLVCLPFAGSGAGFYRAWKDIPTYGIDVLPVQLPGREELFLDEPFSDALEAAAHLAPRSPNSPRRCRASVCSATASAPY